MYILIDSVSFINKGSELMLNAIIDRLKDEKSFSGAKFVFNCRWKEKNINSNIKKLGMYKLLKTSSRIFDVRKYLPDNFIENFGFVKQENIDIMLHAGGYSYGDQWENGYSKKSNRNEEMYYKELKQNNTINIILPQAFGSFEKPLSRERITKIYPYIDIIFARDRISYDYLIQLFGENKKIIPAPDFTNLCKPQIDKDLYNITNDSIIIIPNSKMLTHTSGEIAKTYENFLKVINLRAKESGKRIVLLNHEGKKDREIIKKLKSALDFNVVVLDGLDAKNIKGAIGSAYLVISSRYHGVVNALCQNVPVLCTSWSHKYKELLDDYDFEEALLSVSDPDTSLNKVAMFMDEEYNKTLRKKLSDKSDYQKQLSQKMWNIIIDYILSFKEKS